MLRLLGEDSVLVIGLGEVGSSLYEIIRGVYPNTVAYDIKMRKEKLPSNVKALHICYPFSSKFIQETVEYANKTNPELVLIESTVYPGTTNIISSTLNSNMVVHSPVNGRIADGMKYCMFNYTKFIGPVSQEAGMKAAYYYQSLGFKTQVLSSPLETEFAKIIDLSYFGLMLGWNQEMRRICEKFDVDFNEISVFLSDVTLKSGHRFPRPVYDGYPIGGHCIIPAVKMLRKAFPSDFLRAILRSDRKRRMEMLKCSVRA